MRELESRQTETEFVVEFLTAGDPVSQVKPREVCLDVDGYGDVVGIEILYLKERAGRSAMNGLREGPLDSEGGEAAVRYDSASDAFYLHLERLTVRPMRQQTVEAVLDLDKRGRLRRITVAYGRVVGEDLPGGVPPESAP